MEVGLADSTLERGKAAYAGKRQAAEGPDSGNTESTQREYQVSTTLVRIGVRARKDKRLRFTSVAHVLTEEFLLDTWRKLNKKGAAGVDGQTIAEFQQQLEHRVRDLCLRLRRHKYRAEAVRTAEIPKGEGKTRTLGIPTVEDRLLQAAVARILNALFEPLFLDSSYGYRPKMSAHGAVRALRGHLIGGRVMHVYEADIRSYFDKVNHDWLRQMLRQRLGDSIILRLIDKWLRAGVMKDGLVSAREEGVPQGGPISPILSNIYLHYALDLWFAKRVVPQCQGYAVLVRYADDFVACFQSEKDCAWLEVAIVQRLRKFSVELAPEKSGRILFGRFARERLAKYGRKPKEFVFLGFRHICGIDRKGKFGIIRFPARERLRRFRERVKSWLLAHNHWKVRDQQKRLSQMLQGLYSYYAIPHSTAKLSAIHHDVMRMWWKMLRRRSQRAKRAAHWSVLKKNRWFKLPTPICVHPSV